MINILPTDFLPAIQWIIVLVLSVNKHRQSNQNAGSSSSICSLIITVFCSSILLSDLVQVWTLNAVHSCQESLGCREKKLKLNYLKQKWELLDSHNHEVSFRNNRVQKLNAASGCAVSLGHLTVFWPHFHQVMVPRWLKKKSTAKFALYQFSNPGRKKILCSWLFH